MVYIAICTTIIALAALPEAVLVACRILEGLMHAVIWAAVAAFWVGVIIWVA